METKNNLLIFFGEYRTFEEIIPQLNGLDKCDIIFSTWDKCEDWTSHESYQINPKITYITEEKIKKILPQCKCIISNVENFPYRTNNTQRMAYHWKVALNSIENAEKYDRIILHRCDSISNFEIFFDKKIEENFIYIDIGFVDNRFWVNDYIFIGKYKSLKNFADTLDYKKCTTNHFSLGESILNNNIKFKDFKSLISINKFNFDIVRYNHVNFIRNLNKENKKLLDFDYFSKEREKFIELNR